MSATDYVSLGDLLALLWRKMWLVALTTLTLGGLAAWYAFAATPTYRSAVVLVPVSVERDGAAGALGSLSGSLGGLAGLAGISVSSSDSATIEALAVLRSRAFIEHFITERNLLPVLLAKEFDAKTGKASSRATIGKAVRRFDKTVRQVSADDRSGLVTLEVLWEDRALAADWAANLVTRINAEMRARAILQTNESVKFLQRELESTREVGTRDAINRLMESQIRRRMLANVTEEYAFRIVDPAQIADADDPVRPKKAVLVLVGLFVGLLLGVAAAFFWEFRRRARDGSRGIP
jgi:uncharacterized protein involved in exopolysaccharide biosynthesis